LYNIHTVWDYELPSDKLSNFTVAAHKVQRQWLKRYEESALSPIIHEQTIILRNEYRLFCIDLLTGREIWTFSPDTSGHEFYQTVRHPHHNSYGYELLLDNNVVYTELAGKLTAIVIEDLLHPVLLWEQNLGEYTVSIKPIRYENTIIVGLTNARGELWICGFHVEDGSMLWSTYIGITTFLSPASTLSIIKDDTIIIGTNHGILTCLDPITGEIIWLRKYSPTKYSLFDYLNKKHFRGKLSGKGFISFNTQFINVDNNNIVYIKPRESEYVYILNSLTGELIEELLIDTNKYYVLTASNDKIVLFEKAKEKEIAHLKIVDIKTGNELFSKTILTGNLQGVVQLNKKELLFKVDSIIHSLRIDDDIIELSKIGEHRREWYT